VKQEGAGSRCLLMVTTGSTAGGTVGAWCNRADGGDDTDGGRSATAVVIKDGRSVDDGSELLAGEDDDDDGDGRIVAVRLSTARTHARAFDRSSGLFLRVAASNAAAATARTAAAACLVAPERWRVLVVVL